MKYIKEKLKYIKRYIWIMLPVLVFLLCISANPATVSAASTDGWNETYTDFQKSEDGSLTYLVDYNGSSDESYMFNLNLTNAFYDDGVRTVTCTSTNPQVCSIDDDCKNITLNTNSLIPNKTALIYVKIKQCGTSVITANAGGKEYRITIIAAPKMKAAITSIKTIDYNSIKIKWNPVPGATGYIIAKARMDSKYPDLEGKVTAVKTIDSADTLTAVIEAAYNTEFGYMVIPTLTVGTKDYYNMPTTLYSCDGQTSVSHTLTYKNAKITKLDRKGSTIYLSWNIDKNVQKYNIYYKNREEAGWKLLYTEKNPKNGSFSKKVTSGQTYIFKVEYVFPKYKVSTDQLSTYVKKKTTSKTTSLAIAQEYYDGQYDNGSWVRTDRTFYYEKNKVLHVVTVSDQKLLDYTMTSGGSVKSKRTIKLGKYDIWGGFYYGPDGNYYVATGFYNYKKSKTKTVIKVMKYSSSWKLIKTCSIKGNASNSFEGVTCPFDAGNCRMMMYGSQLYMFTSRQMFSGHQSNIAFAINTKKMTCKTANYDYTSHSFNQFLRFDGSTMYLSNHGDAWARGVDLTRVTDYGTSKSKTKNVLPFKIAGKAGVNYTGLCEGGMEVTSSNVLIAGTSVPQNYKVAGVTGTNNKYTRNVFLTITNKKTMKTTRKWLTTYNPKTSKVDVGEVRMVKLSDAYVAIMYSTYSGNKSTLHYVLVDAAGKVISHKKYSGKVFTGSTQPILYQGSIVWTDVKRTFVQKNKGGYYTYNIVDKVYYCRIPAF